MKKFALVGALAALTIATAACGGGSDTLSEDDYINELEDICSRADGDLSDIDDPADYSGIAEASEEAISITNDAIDDINELEPPEDFERDHDDFVGALEDVVGGFEDLRDAADDEDDEAILEASETLADASGDADEAAENLDAEDCIGVGDEGEDPVEPDEPTDTTIEDEPADTTEPDEPADTTEPGDDPTETTADETIPRITVPPVDMTMPSETEPPVMAGSDIGTFDFDNLTTPAGYEWENIDDESLATVQDTFATAYEGQIALIGGAFVADLENATEFRAFAFFWNEDDIVASGTGQEFLDGFTGTASTFEDALTPGGFPVTTWIDTDGAEGVGAIDSDVSVILYGDPGSTETMLAFFDAFVAAQG